MRSLLFRLACWIAMVVTLQTIYVVHSFERPMPVRRNLPSLLYSERQNGKDMDCTSRAKLLAISKTSQSESEFPPSSKRRDLFGSVVSVSLFSLVGLSCITPSVAIAAETASKKPFAPLENLLPAIRVKRSIDSAMRLTKSLMTPIGEESSSETVVQSAPSREKTLAQLENLILKPTSYVQAGLQLQGVPSKPADLYLKDYRSVQGDLPFQKALVQSGDVDAWKRLKRREKKLEQSSSIRAALNAYTDALSFSGDSYLLKVDAQTKSSMVREDRLPDIKQVITSDMGMRYLYRNQVLTAMDDVKAELEYQLKQQPSNFDGTELLDLLVLAGNAMDRWLSLVPEDDVKEALKAIAEEETIAP